MIQQIIKEGIDVSIMGNLYENVSVVLGQYVETKQNAITIIDDEGVIAKASIANPDIVLDVDEVIIKDYSENKGVFKSLIYNNIIEDTGRRFISGYEECPIAKINDYSIVVS